MRPPGPEPVTRVTSIFFSAASFRASGEMRTRPPAGAGTGATGAVAGTAGTDAGFGSLALAATGTGGATGVATAGAAVLRAGVPTTSPGLPIAQSGSPMATCAPAAENIFSSVPAKKLSSSIVALSVSTSASISPALITSPSFFSHLTSVPTVMVSLSFGMSMNWAMGKKVARSG